MKKIVMLVVLLGVGLPVAFAKHAPKTADKPAVVSTEKAAFQARRKQIKELIKKYKKASAAEKPAVKAELEKVVSTHVDAQLEYMKARIAAERTNLDNWEKKIAADEKNLAAVKAQRVEDLLSGAAKKKQKEAKKAWKKQIKAVK